MFFFEKDDIISRLIVLIHELKKTFRTDFYVDSFYLLLFVVESSKSPNNDHAVKTFDVTYRKSDFVYNDSKRLIHTFITQVRK